MAREFTITPRFNSDFAKVASLYIHLHAYIDAIDMQHIYTIHGVFQCVSRPQNSRAVICSCIWIPIFPYSILHLILSLRLRTNSAIEECEEIIWKYWYSNGRTCHFSRILRSIYTPENTAHMPNAHIYAIYVIYIAYIYVIIYIPYIHSIYVLYVTYDYNLYIYS